jgi:hypothetical protein
VKICLRVCSAGSSPAADAPEVVNLKIPHGSRSIANKAEQVSPCGANFELRHLGRLKVAHLVRFELQRRPTIVSAAKPRRGQTKSLIELQPAGDAVDHTEAALPLSVVQLRPTT